MARVEIDQAVLKNVSGTLTASSTATVYVYARGTTTPVTVYQTESGSTTYTQPISVSNGRIEGWVESGQSLDLAVTDAATTYTQPWEAIAATTVNTIPTVTFQDEGVSLPQRSVVNFAGSGVRAQDSGGNTLVTIDRQVQVNNVLDYGAVGNGSTNDRAAIQAAIDALPSTAGSSLAGGIVYFPPGRTYRVNSSLVIDLKANVTLLGGGAGYGGSVLTAYQTDGTPLISAQSSYYCRIDSLGIRSSGPSFTGRLLDARLKTGSSDTWGLVVRDCWFYAGPSVPACIDLEGGDNLRIDHCHFDGGNIAIRGRYDGTGSGGNAGYCNAVTVNDCYFIRQWNTATLAGIPIKNPGQNWRITNNTIEPMADDNGRFVYSDTTANAANLLVMGNWWGDLGNATSGAFVETSGYGINVLSNYCQGSNSTVGVKFNGTTQGVVIQGNLFEGQSPGVDRNGQTVTRAVITGNGYYATSSFVSGATGFTGNSMIDDGGAGIYFSATNTRY